MLTGAHSTGAKNCADRAGAHSASADSTGATGTCVAQTLAPAKKDSRDISPVSPTFCISAVLWGTLQLRCTSRNCAINGTSDNLSSDYLEKC